MSDSTVRFGLLVSMFQAMLRDRSAAKKRKRFRTFLDRAYTGQDYFGAVRLILPSLDRERGSYGLKESTLATCLVDALGIARDSEDALRLINWRKGGARTGANAGNFSLVAAEVLQRRQGIASGGLTIRELNDALDQLASKENRDEGIVLKDLGSKWEPGDRSGKWMKLKPDYIHANADLDVLIIGGYFGSGRHGGEVAQFLVGLAERSDLSSYPMRFISFCRVGTGLTDEDLDALITKLKPHFSKEDLKVPDIVSIESQKVLGALDTGEKRKRGRPPHTNIKRGRAAPVTYRKTQARIGNRPAKINSDDLEHSDSMGEDDGKAAYEPKENDDDTEKYENINDQRKEESSSEQDVKDQEFLGALYTVEKRKRGRPRTNINRGRAPVPYQRTRARTGKCRIKINLDELEHSDSMGEEDGKAAHELKEEIGDECDNIKDRWKEESTSEQDAKDQESTDDALLAKSFTKEETPKKDILCQGSEIVPVMKTQQGAGKKLEQMIDPLQAMLLDMIPTLSHEREGVGSSSFAVGQKSEGDGISLTEEGEHGEKSLQDPDVNPVKKKVSYKDLADRLLKDW